MTDIQYETISDDHRSAPRISRMSPWVEAALDGKTVRVQLPQAALGGYYKVFANHGKKLRTRADGKEATILWAEEPAVADVPDSKIGELDTAGKRK